MILGEQFKVTPVIHPHEIKVAVPGSKSITNRALLIAALAEGTSVLKGVLFSDDSRNFIQALLDLGFPVKVDEDRRVVEITGFGGQIPGGDASSETEREIYVGSAGTAARFLTAYLGLSKGRFRINASEQMKKRPMGELLDALKDLGALVEFQEAEDHFPFVIGNQGFAGNEVEVDVDKSSQFLSALLIASVLSREDFRIRVKGSHGMEYVRMTIAMMEQFGVKVEQLSEAEYQIRKSAAYHSGEYQIEPDVSAACYFYSMAPLLQVPVQVCNVTAESLQGDIRFLQVLSDMGCEICDDSEGIRVLPPSDGIKGGAWDLSAFSDQALTLAAIAPFAKNPVTIANVGHIRYQECDRIAAIRNNLKKLGIETEESDGTIVIMPGEIHGCEIETYEDHRVAMAFSLVGLRVSDVIILNPSCCRKTFEDYFEVLQQQVY